MGHRTPTPRPCVACGQEFPAKQENSTLCYDCSQDRARRSARIGSARRRAEGREKQGKVGENPTFEIDDDYLARERIERDLEG